MQSANSEQAIPFIVPVETEEWRIIPGDRKEEVRNSNRWMGRIGGRKKDTNSISTLHGTSTTTSVITAQETGPVMVELKIGQADCSTTLSHRIPDEPTDTDSRVGGEKDGVKTCTNPKHKHTTATMTNITTSHVTYPVTTITATPPPTTNELVTDNMSMVETIGTEENSITITNAELCKAPPSKRSWLQNLQKRTDNCRRALKALRTRAMVESQTAAVTRTTQTKLSIIEKTDLDLIFISNVLSVAWHVELMKGRKVIELNREYKTLCSKLTEAADEFATQKSRGMKHVLSLKATLTSYRTLLDGYNIDTALKDEKVDIIAAATKLYEQQVSRSCP